MRFWLIFVMMIAFGGTAARAQSTVRPTESSKAEQKGIYKSEKKFRKRGKRTYAQTLRIEAAARQKEVEKLQKERNREREKALRRPADPTYFGHKRKPKKRKPGKRKLCKECGIVH